MDNEVKFKFYLPIINREIYLTDEDFIGSGSYGDVYILGKIEKIKYVIKVTKNNGGPNDYLTEEHFYKKHNNNGGIPKFLCTGSTLNLLNMKKYDYMIIEYVGFFSLRKILNVLPHGDEEEKEIFTMLYKSINEQLRKIHNSGIVLRDIKPDNIVVNDIIGFYFATKYYELANQLNDFTHMICQCDTSFQKIKEKFLEKKYDDIVKFIDFGIAFDIGELYKSEIYNKTNNFTLGSFVDLDGLEGLFASTLTYISPFSMINLSKMLYNKFDENIMIMCKNNISFLLILSDIWSVNILFAICIHDNIYRKKKYSRSIQYHKTLFSGNLSNIPLFFDKNQKFILKKELRMTNVFFCEEIENIFNHIKLITGKILELANFIKNDTEWIKKKVIVKLNYSEENIIEIKNKTSEIFNEVNNIIESKIIES